MLPNSRMFWKVRATPAVADDHVKDLGGSTTGAPVADLALGGDGEAGEAVEEGRSLAGAVGADQADDLAAVDGEVDAVVRR